MDSYRDQSRWDSTAGYGPPWERDRAKSDLIDAIRSALAEDDPPALLSLASAILEIGAEWGEPPEAPISGGPLFQSFMDTAMDSSGREISALLAVMGELSDDEVLRAKIRRELATRPDVRPPWLSALDQAGPCAAVEIVGVLGNGDYLVVGVELAGNHGFSVVVHVDHTLGSMARNAFVIPEPVGELVDFLRTHDNGPDASWNVLALADARARVADAVELSSLLEPFPSPTWPQCRPLVEWVARLLPPGGTGYPRPGWPSGAVKGLRDRLHPHPVDDHRARMTGIVWFATGYRRGQPARWGPDAVDYEPWVRPWEEKPFSYKQTLLRPLRAKVGGDEALRALDADPLPDEPFAWDGIEEDITATVNRVLGLCDRFCDDRVDTEFRTACRRFLARVASTDPNQMRPPADAETCAAQVCWAVGRANNLFAGDGKAMQVRDMMSYFGLSGTVAKAARTMIIAGGLEPGPDASLGSSAYLVSARRLLIMLLRDKYKAMADR